MTDFHFEELKSIALPVAKLMDDPHGLHPDYADRFKSAGVIFVFDRTRPDDPQSISIMHGAGMLQEVAHGSAARPHVMVISVDPSRYEDDMVAACCKVHRGGYDAEERVD